MNAVMKWFVSREKARTMLQVIKMGLEVRDEALFETELYRQARNRLIYNVVFLLLMVFLVLRYMGVI